MSAQALLIIWLVGMVPAFIALVVFIRSDKFSRPTDFFDYAAMSFMTAVFTFVWPFVAAMAMTIPLFWLVGRLIFGKDKDG